MEFRVRAFHPLWRSFPTPSAIPHGPITGSRNPIPQAGWFRLFPFRSPLLRESLICFIFHRVPEMFHFPWCRSEALFIQTSVSRHNTGRVAPFGNLRIKACMPLPEAYRSLPRPSSPLNAKASPAYSYLLSRFSSL